MLVFQSFNFAREGYLKTSNLDRAHGKST
uniref:Uncharacterized protein n=1 Tax=Physcomitrium patens TaxID=3218 RepID=A0A7I4DJL8_PHYPA